MRRLSSRLILLAVIVASGCSKTDESGSQASPSPSPEPVASIVAAASPVATDTPSPVGSGAATIPVASPATPTPTPTATPNINLLSWQNGTIVRTYPAAVTNNPNTFATSGLGLPATDTGPDVIVFELPGTTQFTSFAADLPSTDAGAKPATVDIAVASDSATGDYRDVGTLTAEPSAQTKTLASTASGRWVRVTETNGHAGGFAAAGTIAPRPATAPPPIGIFVEANSPYKDGQYLGQATDTDPWYRRIVQDGETMSGARCYDGHPGVGYPGAYAGRTWTYTDGTNPGHAIFNDEGTAAVGDDGGSALYLMRVANVPKFCVAQKSGGGPHRVLMLESEAFNTFWPVDQNSLPGYAYTREPASMLDHAALAGADIVVLNMVCDASTYLAKGQSDALLQWVQAGHKLIIDDADECSKSAYAFLPYPFITSNPGARGASGSRLIVVESDALGATDKNDTHAFDPATFINKGSNQLGDANIVTTEDPHWCGHLFGTNSKNDNGFMQMYAPYGQGILIYDGFDHDDSGNPGYERVRTLEFQLPVPAGMPCSASVASSFIVQPSSETTIRTGAPLRLPFTMEVLATLGWKGHVTVRTSGPFRTDATPSSFDLVGSTQKLKLVVNVPASAKAGVYTIAVTGDDGQGHTAQANITLTASAPLAKKIARHQRIRVYGIHFDVDSAHIQPQSEKVIAEIAQLMRGNPSVRFQVEGHTDSDGGPTYNLGLSQRRAQAVVDDLTHRYSIARSRMIPKGFGLTRPVAPNTTPANKALNRRVELLAL